MRACLIFCLTVLALSVQAQEQIQIQLVTGHNLISTNIFPAENMFAENENRGPDVRLMFEQLRGPDGVHLVQVVIDMNGRFYSPPFEFCNLIFWDINQGLRVVVSENTEIIWEGERIPPDADIQLDAGWNIVAYYPQYDLNANAEDFYVISPVIDNIVLAKDEHGRFMLPEFNFSNMDPWTEGKGYFLRAAEDGVLNYPEELDEEPVIFEGGDHWALDVSRDINMSVLVTDIDGPDGFEPGAGDQIGAFNQAGDFVGHGDVFAGVCGIAVWQEDGFFDQLPGLLHEEEFGLIYWGADQEVEFDINIENVIDGPGLSFDAQSYTVIEISVDAEMPGRDQQVPLNQGWNMVSINVAPDQEMWQRDEGPDIELMMQQVVEVGNLEIMKDEEGRFYTTEFEFNNIPYWELTDGYQVKVTENTEAVWSGCPISPDREIPLEESWNLIAYFPDYNLNAEEEDFYVLSSIIDNVIIAKNGNGQFMTPPFGFSNMPPWEPGQGYHVKVDADVVLQYPDQRDEENAIYQAIESHWAAIPATDNNMSLLVTSISGIDLSSGCQIAACTTDGQIVGVGDVQDGKCGIAIWGAEAGKEGLQPGQAFELKLWDANQASETNLSVSTLHKGAGLVYEADGFSVVDVAIATTTPDNYFLSGAYPNPFNNRTTVKYGLPEAGQVNLAVYDLSGRKVMELANGENTAGVHEMDINCTDLTSGIYILSLNANRVNLTQKLVLVK